jgi:hypothetical protein
MEWTDRQDTILQLLKGKVDDNTYKLVEINLLELLNSICNEQKQLCAKNVELDYLKDEGQGTKINKNSILNCPNAYLKF